jgi:two-component system, NarL family, response regulator NreC
MKLKVLIIDDHPSMIEGYKTILSYSPFGYQVEVTVAHNCEKAYEIITRKKGRIAFDVFLLDYSLPSYPEKEIFNGQDLAILIKEYYNQPKIMILTSHVESILLYDLVKKVEPNGLLVKSDFTPEELMVAFDVVWSGGFYQSETIKKVMRDLKSNYLYLDYINRQIIVLLSQGISNKSIPSYLNISLSAVEKRKAFIKIYFNIRHKGNDEDIIRIAKERGLV